MAIVGNRAYNSPEIGQAMQNIAGLFAPPDPADLVNYAQAGALRQKQGIISKLQSNPEFGGFDHQAILADLYDPTQSFYRVDTDDATTRRGQDITAATSRANNLQTNQFNTISDMYGPLNPGQVRPELPAPLTDFMGLPAMPATAGTPKPLSESEVKGDLLLQAIEDGLLDPADAAGAYQSDINVEHVVTPDGPKIVTRADAVGQEPFFNKGAEAKPENAVAVLPNGTQVPAVQNPDGSWRHAQSGEPLPNDIRVFKMPAPQGSAEEVGLSKPTNTMIEKALIDIDSTKAAATTLRNLIAKSPSSQGLVGWLRGTGQDIIQTGGELGQFFGGAVAEVNEDIAKGMTDAGLGEAFDPSLPAIELMSNYLAWQYAKTLAGDRVSNEMLRNARRALGMDSMTANQASSITRLDQVLQQLDQQAATLQRVRQQGIDSIGAESPAAEGEVARPQTEEEYNALPSGALFVDPDDGQTYRKP